MANPMLNSGPMLARGLAQSRASEPTYAALRTALDAGTYQEGQAVYVETSDGSNRGAAGWGHIEASGTDNGVTVIANASGPAWVRDDVDVIAPTLVSANTTPGTTDMTSAVQSSMSVAAAIGSAWAVQRFPHVVSDTVNVPEGINIQSQPGSHYANPDRATGGKISATKEDAGAVLYLAGVRLQSPGSHVDGLWMTSANANDLTGVAHYMMQCHNLFNVVFENLTVEHFNSIAAVWTSGQCNKLVFKNPRILLGGSRNATSPASAYGYGLYLALAPDSQVVEPYIEALDGVAIALGSNSKIVGGFIDLCERAVFGSGQNLRISGASMKFHAKGAISLDTTYRPILENLVIRGWNTGGAINTDADSAAIRLGASVDNARIVDCDFVHQQGWRGPHLSPVLFAGASGNSAVMDGARFGDIGANAAHVLDANGNWSAGRISVRNWSLELGGARKNLAAPVAFSGGMSVASDTVTVTQGGSTYVANGRGRSFPFTASGTFVYDSADDNDPTNGSNEWTLLEERSNNGFVVPNDVTDDFGDCTISVVDGSTDDWGLTLGLRCNISGTIKTRGLTKLVRANGGSTGPKFVCDQIPATVGDVISTNGALGLRGLAWPIPTIEHTGGATNEQFSLGIPAGANERIKGRLTYTGRTSSTDHVTVSADVEWNGTAITVSNIQRAVSGSAYGGNATFVVSAGMVALQFSSASATALNGSMNFDGAWVTQ